MSSQALHGHLLTPRVDQAHGKAGAAPELDGQQAGARAPRQARPSACILQLQSCCVREWLHQHDLINKALWDQTGIAMAHTNV